LNALRAAGRLRRSIRQSFGGGWPSATRPASLSRSRSFFGLSGLERIRFPAAVESRRIGPQIAAQCHPIALDLAGCCSASSNCLADRSGGERYRTAQLHSCVEERILRALQR